MIKKMENWKQVACVVAWLVVLAALVALRGTYAKLTVLEQKWQAQDPRTTRLGRLQLQLSSFHWLGVMRPDPLNDPYKVCEVQELRGNSFVFLSRLLEATTRLDCLEHEMNAALAQHYHFRKCLFTTCAVVLLVVVVAIRVVLATRIGAEEKHHHSLDVASRVTDGTKTRKEPHQEKRKLNMHAKDRPKYLGRWTRQPQHQHNLKWIKLPPPNCDSIVERLEKALDAALQCLRSVFAGLRVPCDSLEWWPRCSSGTKEKLVVPPRKHFHKKIHRYRFPKSSRKPPQLPPLVKALVREPQVEEYLLVSLLCMLFQGVQLMLLTALALH